MSERVIIGIILAPIIIFIIWSGGVPFFLLFFIVNLIGLYEFYSLVEKRTKFKTFPLISIITGSLIILFLFFRPQIKSEWLLKSGVSLIITLYVIFLSLIFVLKKEIRFFLPSVSVNLFGVFYISYLLSYSILLRSITPYGREFFVFLILTIWLSDSMAYFIGTKFGRNFLSRLISPKKTVEGFFAEIFTSLICSFLFFKITKFSFISNIDWIIMGFIIGIFSVVGDLSESLLKRNLGVKDSSNFIPQHGGMLDKIDSLLFVSPLIYWYIKLFVLR